MCCGSASAALRTLASMRIHHRFQHKEFYQLRKRLVQILSTVCRVKMNEEIEIGVDDVIGSQRPVQRKDLGEQLLHAGLDQRDVPGQCVEDVLMHGVIVDIALT